MVNLNGGWSGRHGAVYKNMPEVYFVAYRNVGYVSRFLYLFVCKRSIWFESPYKVFIGSCYRVLYVFYANSEQTRITIVLCFLDTHRGLVSPACDV